MFRKLDVFPFSVEGRETPILFSLPERAEPTEYESPSPHVKTETDPVSETAVFSSYLEFRTVDKVHKPSN
jgi:hypothetical protein